MPQPLAFLSFWEVPGQRVRRAHRIELAADECCWPSPGRSASLSQCTPNTSVRQPNLRFLISDPRCRIRPISDFLSPRHAEPLAFLSFREVPGQRARRAHRIELAADECCWPSPGRSASLSRCTPKSSVRQSNLRFLISDLRCRIRPISDFLSPRYAATQPPVPRRGVLLFVNGLHAVGDVRSHG